MSQPTPPPQNPSPQLPPQEPGRRPPMQPMRSMFPWFLLIAALCGIGAWIVTRDQGSYDAKVEYSKFLDLAKQDKLASPIEIHDDKVLAEMKPEFAKEVKPEGVPAKVAVTVYAEVRPGDTLIHWQIDQTKRPYRFENGSRSVMLLGLLNILLPILLVGGIIFFISRSMKGGGGGPGGFLGGFNRSRHKMFGKEQTRVRLADVAGVQEAKDEVGEIISFLRDPKKFQRLGGRVPRGVLLSGSPGCGKTLLAKAVAGEADVPFFSLSGSDFVEMFVGVGASRVRDLFKQAKEMSPCIIFLDEIDAVGRKRGGGMGGGGHDERDQTLNAILVEMDGFESSDQVIVIAATNRVDVLDPALTRPGRFDRTITVPLPDVKGRAEILAVHARKVKLSPVVDMEMIARGTPGFSGAELEALINEAAIMATLQDKESVEHVDLEEARDKVRWGRAKKSRKVEQQERELVAWHEAGHTIVSMFSPDADPLHKVTIIPRGDYGGAMFSLPKDDRAMLARRKCLAAMRVACGGRIAEERKCGDISNGASSDIRQVTAYARHMVKNWGMSDELGFVSWENEDRGGLIPEVTYSSDTAQRIDGAVRKLVDEAYAQAKTIIDEHWDELDRLAQALLKHETLTAEECKQIIEGKGLGKATVADLLALEAAKAAQPPETPESPPQA